MKKTFKLLLPFSLMISMLASTFAFNSIAANGTPPDPNGDGVINSADTVFVQAYLHGNYEVSDITVLDFNEDLVVNYVDVLAIQRYLIHDKNYKEGGWR